MEKHNNLQMYFAKHSCLCSLVISFTVFMLQSYVYKSFTTIQKIHYAVKLYSVKIL